MASWHVGADPLLAMDVPALAATVSAHVAVCGVGNDVSAAMVSALASTRTADAVGCSRVATLIVPHDLSWQRGISGNSDGAATYVAAAPLPPAPPRGMDPGAVSFVHDCAAALQACPRGKAALYIGGRAALADVGALQDCGRIAAATGAVLLCENAFARLDRGAGLPAMQRLPYFPHEAAATLAAFNLLVLVDARCATFLGADRSLMPLISKWAGSMTHHS